MKNKTLFISIVILLFVGTLFYYLSFYKDNSVENEKILQEEVNQEINMINQEGLNIEILEEGAGKGAENGETVVVHYTGTLEDGTKFDSSRDRGVSFSFTLGAGKVIEGWDKGLLGMKVGEKRRLTISPELAYGENGVPGLIPAGSILTFEVELLGVR
ncbi:MAG: FKBP-type peptidyl-prolyl cis-trans isomerase [Candidatus Paceibacterota bacterium]